MISRISEQRRKEERCTHAPSAQVELIETRTELYDDEYDSTSIFRVARRDGHRERDDLDHVG